MAFPVANIDPSRTGMLQAPVFTSEPSAFVKGWGGEPSVQNDLGKPTKPVAKATNDPIRHLKDRADELGDSATGGLGGLAGTVINGAGKYGQIGALVAANQLGLGGGGLGADNIWKTGQDASAPAPAAQPAYLTQAAEIFRNMASMNLNDVEQAAGNPNIWQALGFQDVSNVHSAQLGSQAVGDQQRQTAQGMNA